MPWGDTSQNSPVEGSYDLSDLMDNGELIMLTLSGPETYYDYRGRALGVEYMMCEKFDVPEINFDRVLYNFSNSGLFGDYCRQAV